MSRMARPRHFQTPCFSRDCRMLALEWSPWIPFDAASCSALTPRLGVYSVRVIGHQALAYIGQTSRDLRARICHLTQGATRSDSVPPVRATLAVSISRKTPEISGSFERIRMCSLLWVPSHKTGGWGSGGVNPVGGLTFSAGPWTVRSRHEPRRPARRHRRP